jgi:hypothetical protein
MAVISALFFDVVVSVMVVIKVVAYTREKRKQECNK